MMTFLSMLGAALTGAAAVATFFVILFAIGWGLRKIGFLEWLEKQVVYIFFGK